MTLFETDIFLKTVLLYSYICYNLFQVILFNIRHFLTKKVRSIKKRMFIWDSTILLIIVHLGSVFLIFLWALHASVYNFLWNELIITDFLVFMFMPPFVYQTRLWGCGGWWWRHTFHIHSVISEKLREFLRLDFCFLLKGHPQLDVERTMNEYEHWGNAARGQKSRRVHRIHCWQMFHNSDLHTTVFFF